ncbi:Ldh family oxidoreductase [Stenotrophomonas sp. MMGLT7]|uniref:Ldh family oxidoreductase n=1 Tax=Stenotrophomonas sp. MMGLT7 TaxID=2901227 RepID=UPI001E5D7AE7|nr:Ldh family oxidoreductase [Stenotrophomonas sp. MMGLT7]MCD7097597.1 Ldh family oxidoreductase [Stenotrophomonas sp. MMGLT7]
MSVSLSLGQAETFAASLLQAMKVPPAIAHDVAEHLVSSDRCGYASHGVSILPGYCRAIADGVLDGTADGQLLVDTGIFQAWDGQHGFGQHIGKRMLLSAFEGARRHGQCVLTLRGCHHLGRMGFYAEMAAREGLVLLAFTNIINREPLVAPFGGAEGRLTTNPLCFGIPLPDGRPPLVVDMATSAVALNKVRVYAENGQPAPAGSLIDAQGNPTTDPGVMFANPHGSMLPFGGHKGYALGVLTELLAGVYSGGGTVQPEHPRNGKLATNNLFALVFDPAHPSHGADPAWQRHETGAFIDYLLACPPQPGGSGVQYPGQYEAANQARHADHIELGQGSWDSLAELADKLGVALPEGTAAAA